MIQAAETYLRAATKRGLAPARDSDAVYTDEAKAALDMAVRLRHLSGGMKGPRASALLFRTVRAAVRARHGPLIMAG